MQKALVVILWKPSPLAAEKKVLVLRLIPRRGGFWQPVTGRVEAGESFAEGALREAEEETGLSFERRPQYLGLEISFPGRDGYTVRERSFFLPIVGGDSPPSPKLDGHEHDEFLWLSPAEAAAKVKHEGNRAAILRAAGGASPLFLSGGNFFQDGEEVTHTRTAELLHRSLQKEENGTWLVKIGNEELEVVLEDCPRFAKSFDRATGMLLLSDGTSEILQPETLRIRADNSALCRLKNGWEARLLSPAYYELMKDAEELSAGKYVLHFLGRQYNLAIAH